MPLDAVCLTALRGELEAALLGARIDKISMPARREIHIVMRSKEGSKRLLLSADPTHARAHITEHIAENPLSPPMFCMLLRKHLNGARLRAIEQPPLERVLLFRWDATDDMGVACHKTLACEMMGRHSNLILCGGDGRIIDCLIRVDMEMSERRQVLPGLFYRHPPIQEKLNPIQTDEDTWRSLVHGVSGADNWGDWLLRRFFGLSPLVCRELAYRARDNTGASFLTQILDWRNQVLSGALEPWMLYKEGNIFDFSYLPITQYGDACSLRKADSFSRMLDAFLTRKGRQQALAAQSQDLNRRLAVLRLRIVRRLANQERERLDTDNRERFREQADLLMSNLYEITPGASSVSLIDFFRNEPCEIRLDPMLTAQQNAAAYYKNYRRAKSAAVFLAEQITQGNSELAYIDSVIEALSRAENTRDILDIRRELVSEGYIRDAKGTVKKGAKPAASEPIRFVSSTGHVILAGRNNRQNDALTFKTAAKGDMWLHARQIPGSHVIVPAHGSGDDNPDPVTLSEAAVVAATLSQASEGGKVAVDYTRTVHVKKPPGAKPGMVIYDKYRTVIAVPDRQLVDRLREKS